MHLLSFFSMTDDEKNTPESEPKELSDNTETLAESTVADETVPDSGTTEPSGGSGNSLVHPENQDGDPADRRGPRKRHPLVRLLRGIFIPVFSLLGLIILIFAVFFGIALIDRRNPTDSLPAGFDAYLRVESAGDLFLKTIDLEVADIMLTSPNLAPIRGLVAGLRETPELRGDLFSRASDIRIDATIYGENYLLIGDLGARSALTRMASPFYRRIDYLRIRELEYRGTGDEAHFVYNTPTMSLYFITRKNLIIASTDLNLLFKAAEGQNFRDRDAALDEALSQETEGDLRILANPQTFLADLASGNENLSRMLALMNFSEYAVVDLSVTNDTIELNAAVPVESEDKAISRLINERSAAPAIFNSLPEDVSYASIVAAGSPEDLMEIIQPLAGEKFVEALNKGDRAARGTLGMGIEELLFSWTGSELGLFGLESYPEPVFFIRVENERKRKEVFDDILDSFLIKGDDETVIDGVRLTRISLPWYITALLDSLEISLPEPYFAVGDGFMFLSVSGEAVAETVAAINEKKFLVRTEAWEKSGGRVPASAALGVVYSLDRSIPFFLQGRGSAADALRLYRQGVATLRFDGGRLRISLAAAASGGQGVMAMPGFPIKTESKLVSSTYALPVPGGDRLYWLENDNTLVEYDAASGTRLTARLDDEARLAVGDGIVWVLSRRGNIYAFKAGLSALEGFPIATSFVASADPVAVGGQLALAERENNSLVIVNTDGERRELPVVFNDPLVSPPAWRNGLWAAYPKGFLASLHLFDDEGTEQEGWPVPVEEIAYGSPVFIDEPAGSADSSAGNSAYGGFRIAFLSQAGSLIIYSPAGEILSQVHLEGVFYTNPVWAPETSALYALSESGTLFKVQLDGDVDRIDISGIKAKEGRISVMDVQGDAGEEVFVSDTGAAVYGFTSDLFPLEGFPLPGGRTPSFVDLNADGRVDLITGGFDNTIRAYSFR